MIKEELKRLKNEVLDIQKSSSIQEFSRKVKWNSHDNGDRLISYSLAGKNVLVIGSEAILKKDFPENFNDFEVLNKAKGDSEQLLLEYLKKENDIYEKYDSFAKIQEANILFWDDLDSLIGEKEDEWRENALEMIDPSLRLLLSSKCFRLVITTSFNPILEFALQKIWGGGLVVKNIHDYDINQTDIMTEQNRKSEFYDINPTLYYAFGKLVAGTSTIFAIIDDRKIYTIDCWLGARKPNNLLQYILKKDIIAVGCKFENWVFRFFWYILGQKPNMSTANFGFENSNKNCSVAIMLSGSTDDEERTKKFLKTNKIKYYDDSRAFMSLLAPELIQNDFEPQSGDIFISYASEDFATANLIYEYLKSQRQSVWFDIRLRAGDLYDERIKDGIEQCNIFLPILSNQTKKDLQKDNNDRYYQKEWKKANEEMLKEREIAEDKRRMFVTIPVVIEDYSCTNNEYHNDNLIPECIYKASCFFAANEHVQLSDLLSEIEAQREVWNKKHAYNTNNHKL